VSSQQSFYPTISHSNIKQHGKSVRKTDTPKSQKLEVKSQKVGQKLVLIRQLAEKDQN